jgi:hypothetical protein
MHVRVERDHEARRLDAPPEAQVGAVRAHDPAQEEQRPLARAAVARARQEEAQPPPRARPAQRRAEAVERPREVAVVAREEEILERPVPGARFRDPPEQPVDVGAFDPAVPEAARERAPLRARGEGRGERRAHRARIAEREQRAQERRRLAVGRRADDPERVAAKPARVGRGGQRAEAFGEARRQHATIVGDRAVTILARMRS